MSQRGTTIEDDLLLFSERRASRVSGISTRRLQAWADASLVKPSMEHRLSPRSRVRFYGFNDLVELLVITEMLERGASIVRIHRLLRHLRTRWGHETPLRDLHFAVAAGKVYWREPGHPWCGDDQQFDQIVIHEFIDLDTIRARVRAAAAQRWGTPGTIERRRGALASKPVFAGTRVPVEAVQAYLRRGTPPEEILEAYPLLEPADIEAARSSLRA